MGLEKLNEFKKKKGLTNSQLSQMTGITISTIDKITSGNNTNPKLRTIEALCNALGCTLNDLVCDIESSNEQKAPIIIDKSNDDKQKLLHNYESLNNTGKNKLLE
ncbi:helix-turn-helix domain-containing protein, partial [Pseudoruminococcus massiliensis]|uniref:helix-turn-helix domain-containing protein n=1 Tax=Pseudoruminococcus massiliensis TaxID=2086583 RepID=UPI0039A1B7A3